MRAELPAIREMNCSGSILLVISHEFQINTVCSLGFGLNNRDDNAACTALIIGMKYIEANREQSTTDTLYTRHN